MAFTAYRTWVVGEIVTAAMLNEQIKMNGRYLKGQDGAITLEHALILPDGAGYYLHIPILTTVQRDALTPTAGMVIYNSTTTQFNKYENAAWRADLGYNSAHANLSGLTNDDHTQYQKEADLTTKGDIYAATGAGAVTRLGIGANNLVLTADSTKATGLDWKSGGITAVRKTANEDVLNSVALQNDDHLFFAVAANEVWQFEAYIYAVNLVGSTPMIKFAFTTPSGSIIYQFIGKNAADAFTVQEVYASAGVMTAGNDIYTNPRLIKVSGLLINAGTAGNLQFQFAQNTLDATQTTRVLANSCLIAHKLA